MKRLEMRFSPPRVDPSPALRWVLAAAFGGVDASIRHGGSPAALALGERLRLASRLAARLSAAGQPGIETELSAWLRRERARTLALELRFEHTLGRVAAAASRVGIPIAVLKGRALVLAGDAAPGSRESSDLDLLVPRDGLDPLHRELLLEGFAAASPRAEEHHLPPLDHPQCVPVELHRMLPGVRIGGRRSAAWKSLEAAGLLERAHARGLDGVWVPARHVRIAHVLVHGLAQHGLTAKSPGWQIVGDLVDLRACDETSEAETAPWWPWLAADLAPGEVDGALALGRLLLRDEDPFAPETPRGAALLARHFTALALDDDYGTALKGRWLERPLTDRSPLAARIALVARTLLPTETSAGSTLPWLRRLWQLAGRWLSARRARSRLGRRPSRPR